MRIVVLAAAWLVAVPAGAAELAALTRPWPEGEALAGVVERRVSWPSSSPFTPWDAAMGHAEPTEATGMLFLPAHAASPLPAVVLLHGSGGVLEPRELTYGRQFAAMGIVALAVDSFAARRDRAAGFVDRLIHITESMLIADAYAALRWLAAAGHADPARVALVGFSYGAMAAMGALNGGIAAIFAPGGERFRAHAAFYGPCIASFADERTTGAPLLILYGTADELIDPDRCAAMAAGFRRGGSEVEVIAYEGAAHQWDGGWGPVRIGSLLNGCRLQVEADGTVRDLRSGLLMAGTLSRRLILALCVQRTPYLINADPAVRQRSNADLGRFLARAFAGE